MTKVVEGSDVEFQETNTQPDVGLQDISELVLDPTNEDLQHERMRFLGTQVQQSILNYWGNENNGIIILSGQLLSRDLNELIAYAITIKDISKKSNWNFDQNNKLAGGVLSGYIDVDLSPKECVNYLVRTYGDDVLDTGIHLDTNMRGSVMWSGLARYFPEFHTFTDIDHKLVFFRSSEYDPLLTIKKESRGFCAGVIEYHRVRKGLSRNVTRNNTPSRQNQLHKPLTFKQMLEYARVTGEVKDVKRHFDNYQ